MSGVVAGTATAATGPRGSRTEAVVAIAALSMSAALACVLASAWLMSRIGPVPVPVTIVATAAWTTWLVRVAGRWSDRVMVRAVPVMVWLVALVVIDAGPGGDLPVPVTLRGLGLVVAGAVVPLWALAFRPRTSHE